MAWTTIKTAGQIPTNTYDFPITALSASTYYAYRGYMIVDGIQYYGNTLTGTTAAISLYVPSGTTGIAGTATITGFTVTGNGVTDSGGTAIIEYGILYTQSATFKDIGTLIYENIEAGVKQGSGVGTESNYSSEATGLASNTTTYYRAYARNAVGSGYGEIKTKQTAVDTVTITMSDWVNNIDSEYNNAWHAKLTTSRPLVKGEEFDLEYYAKARSTYLDEISNIRTIRASACVVRGTTDCGSASSVILTNDTGDITNSITDIIKISGQDSTYDVREYTICVETSTNQVNWYCDYTNFSCITLGEISNCYGGTNYQLTGTNSICANSATSSNPTSNGGTSMLIK